MRVTPAEVIWIQSLEFGSLQETTKPGFRRFRILSGSLSPI